MGERLLQHGSVRCEFQFPWPFRGGVHLRVLLSGGALSYLVVVLLKGADRVVENRKLLWAAAAVWSVASLLCLILTGQRRSP